MQDVILEFYESYQHHAFLVPPLSFFIPIEFEVGIDQCTTVLCFPHSLLKLFSTKSSHYYNNVLDCRLWNSNSHRVTWLHRHLIYIQTLYFPSSHLQPGIVQEVALNIKQGVVQMERAQVRHHLLFENPYRRQTSLHTQLSNAFINLPLSTAARNTYDDISSWSSLVKSDISLRIEET